MKKVITFFVVAVLLIPIIVITLSNAVRFFGYLERGYEVEKIISIMDLDHIKGFMTLIWLALAVVLVFVFASFITFVFKRIKCYIKLFAVCSKEGYKFKLKRPPFASLFGMKTKEDICITRGDDKYLIHFIDVVGRARVFTLIDDRTYDISKTAPGDVSKMPMYDARLTSTERVILNGRQKTIPEFDENDGKHIIMLDPPTMDVRYIDNITKPLFSGYSVGNITYYEAKDFIKLLKRV